MHCTLHYFELHLYLAMFLLFFNLKVMIVTLQSTDVVAVLFATVGILSK